MAEKHNPPHHRHSSTPGLTALGKLDPKESEMIMEYFKTQVLLLKDKELLQKTVREEKKLLVENAKLKKDISDLKILLTEKQQKKKAKAAAASKLTSPGSTAALYAPGPNPKPGPVRERDGRRRRGERKGKRERTNSESVLEEEPRMDVSRLDLRIGRIVGVRYHPLAGALYVQEVDLGEPAPRTVVSALRHIPKEQLQGRLAVLLCNVRPCRVKGVVSTAMVLCGSAPNAHDSDNDDDAQVEFLEPPTNAVPGDRVTFYDYPGEPDRELSPREKVWEQILPDLQTDSRGVATYRGVGFEVRGKGLCRAPTLTNCSIK
ncbi:aminoacyl tRNA synthase complex-interacting multifunctional protein 1-like isoform X3 [Oncorhynchus nerka]|uniref:aminoacyl tRNA synthase complex-interacting multifunctional protein 1-like isoform X3 n=1 Tax=Oncorhynchus nerka TaxID=8023 RepID=UPI0031B7FFFF